MRFYRFIAAPIAAAIFFAGSPLAGRSEQAPTSAPVATAFDALHFRQIGPASMSGRIADLAVYEANPSLYYVATAHGGVWKTTNNGTTFEAQFQDQGLMSIGDVTISQSNPDLVWVGTGESNNRQSTSWGDGVYKSTDGGKTYTNMGLRASRHIHRIVIDPKNNEVVLVAATGSLWGSGGDRGIYKTVDGGRTWKQVLKVDDDTGANDLVMDPTNNQVLWASTYQRRRTACCMNGGGPGSGIWKSTDGGDTWTRLTGGVLDGPLGRIGLDVYRKRPNILYALIEGPGRRPWRRRGGAGGAEEGPGAAPAAPQEAPGGGRGAGGGALNTAPTGMYRSDDAGATWRKVNNANPRPMYFSKVRIDPNDPEVVYLGGVDLHQTLDGGKTDQYRRRLEDALGPPRDLGQSGELESRPHRQRRRPRRVVRHVEDVELPSQPPGRALLSRQLRHGDAVQRLRRHAGQLQLVRAEPGARHRRASPTITGPRCRGATGSSCCRIRRTHRIVLQRVAGRQHGPPRSRDVRVDVDQAPPRSGRAGAALALGHAARAFAARFEGPLRRCQQGLPLSRTKDCRGSPSART